MEFGDPKPKARLRMWDIIWQSSSKVPFDTYGYKPHYLSTYRTYVGMACSLLMLGSWLGLTAYSFSQLFRTPFNIQEATVPASPSFFATPVTKLPVPRVLGGFHLDNGTGFYDPRYVVLTFTQRFTYIKPDGSIDPTGNGACVDACKTKVVLDTYPCQAAASDGSSGTTEMRCPKVVDRPGATDLPKNSNGQLPMFQGAYGDPIYAFLQLEINFNMTALDEEPDMAELLFAGNTFISVDWQYITMNSVTLKTQLSPNTAVDSQRWYPQRLQAPRIEWTVRRRDIKSKSAVLALQPLDKKYMDYSLGLPASSYSDTPAAKANETAKEAMARGLLLKVYFHMDKQEYIILLQPSNTVIGFLAGTGGLVTILALFFGSFGRFYSFQSYTRMCNKAHSTGTIPESYFEKPTSCRLRIEDSNRTVSALNKMQLSAEELRRRISAKSSELMGRVSGMGSRASSKEVSKDLDSNMFYTSNKPFSSTPTIPSSNANSAAEVTLVMSPK